MTVQKKKLGSKVYVQELAEGKQNSKRIGTYMSMERYVRWRRVWHTSMIIHPDRSTKRW